MKVNATQTKPLVVDIDDSEIYQIARTLILGLIDMQHTIGIHDELKIVDNDLVREYLEDCGPYNADRLTEVMRTATNEDIHVVDVLRQLEKKQP